MHYRVMVCDLKQRVTAIKIRLDQIKLVLSALLEQSLLGCRACSVADNTGRA